MPDHVRPDESGIVARHIDAIEAIVKEQNTFLFIRPTEYDSTVLIAAGFATKNMDIHDKSSNWGPMAGMVPCDPHFSKKMEGAAPNPAIQPHQHGAAYPIKLEMPPKLISQMVARDKIKKAEGRWTVNGMNVAAGAPSPSVAFYDGKGPKRTFTFCIQANKVYWVNWSDQQKTRGKLIPVWVWAYRVGGDLKPVTGDYDMWMVGPHVSQFEEHIQSVLAEDPEGHGKSTASEFTQRLSKKLNEGCRNFAPGTCQVFNHGAEAQNYAFTQALDPKLAMFTPAGTSRMVVIWEMPRILADMETMGYLAMYNKRYGDFDARLMGRSTIRGYARLEQTRKEIGETSNPFKKRTLRKEARKQLHGLWAAGTIRMVAKERFRNALEELRAWDNIERVPTLPMDRPRKVRVGDREVSEHGTEAWADRPGRSFAQANWKLLRTAVGHGYESARITRLWGEIQDVAESIGGELTCLKPEDFPADLLRLSKVAQQLLREIRIWGIKATTGAGESDLAVLDKLWKSAGLTAQELWHALAEFKMAAPLKVQAAPGDRS